MISKQTSLSLIIYTFFLLASSKISTYLSNEENEELNILLLPRTVGSQEHGQVSSFILEYFIKIGWSVEVDQFTSKTPFGHKKFTNIIATWNIKAGTRFVMAAHYDLKTMKNMPDFRGAVDSAASCYLLLKVAKFISEQQINYSDKTIQLIFFDGEEAFANWSSSDSLYGSRHLADKWAQDKSIYEIEFLILLDLLGSRDAKIYSYDRKTHHIYFRLFNIQKRLNEDSFTTVSILQDKEAQFIIQDDHIPFKTLGVPTVHLIPKPFPKQWHTNDDNLKNLDFEALKLLEKLLCIFAKNELQNK